MADTNPSNFANRPTDEVKEIASMGGKASHATAPATDNDGGSHAPPSGRNADGTFVPGSDAAKEAGRVGGAHSHDNDGVNNGEDEGRRGDGTFVAGSEAAKEAGHKGGLASIN